MRLAKETEMKIDYLYGKRIQEVRAERAWTQEHLAEAADLSPRTVQRVESGITQDAETLKAIAAAFDVPIEQLRVTRRIVDSRLVGASVLTSPRAFIRSEETRNPQGATKNVLVASDADLREELEDLVKDVFSDREYIGPDDAELWDSYVEQIKAPLEELFERGFAFFVVDENRDILLPSSAASSHIPDFRMRHYHLIGIHNCFRNPEQGPLHRFNATCTTAGETLLKLSRNEQSSVEVFGNALCAVAHVGAEDRIQWCEKCFPLTNGVRLSIEYMEQVTGLTRAQIAGLFETVAGDTTIQGLA
jgi:transcriptional regulator with XRE-family HTH domain